MVNGMTSTACRMARLVALLSVVFVGVLAATGVPASAHAADPHGAAAPMKDLASIGGEYDADTCCHKDGTCVVQFLQFIPASLPSDAAMSLARRSFAAKRYASVAQTTDPPPPRL